MSNELITKAHNEIAPLETEVKSLVVKDVDSRAKAVELRDAIKDAKKEVEEKYHFKENTRKAHEAHRSAKDTENSVYDPIDALETTLKCKVSDYDLKVAIETKRKAASEEAKRREKERKEQEKLEAKAAKAEESGKVEQAENLREQVENVNIAPTFTPPPQKTKKLVWKCNVTNAMQACKSIGEGLIPFNVVTFSQAQLNAFAKMYDGKQQISGLSFYEDVNSRI